MIASNVDISLSLFAMKYTILYGQIGQMGHLTSSAYRLKTRYLVYSRKPIKNNIQASCSTKLFLYKFDINMQAFLAVECETFENLY